jgi:hypothetical protein
MGGICLAQILGKLVAYNLVKIKINSFKFKPL